MQGVVIRRGKFPFPFQRGWIGHWFCLQVAGSASRPTVTARRLCRICFIRQAEAFHLTAFGRRIGSSRNPRRWSVTPQPRLETSARGWARTFKDKLEKDRFIEHLKGAVGRQLHFVSKGGERWLELRDPKVADDEHIIFDARLALLVADLWPVAEPITPLAPAEEITIQELEAVL